MYGRALDSHFSDSMFVFRMILKALTLPFWLIKRHRIRQDMIRMGKHWQKRGLSCREMAVRWAERIPHEYPLGEYDPRVPKLETRFRNFLEKRHSPS